MIPACRGSRGLRPTGSISWSATHPMVLIGISIISLTWCEWRLTPGGLWSALPPFFMVGVSLPYYSCMFPLWTRFYWCKQFFPVYVPSMSITCILWVTVYTHFNFCFMALTGFGLIVPGPDMLFFLLWRHHLWLMLIGDSSQSTIGQVLESSLMTVHVGWRRWRCARPH